ncbi:uncharacterized protein [Triticum aestivum]|uniref:uncharacterized protein isoform X2 n=1 Tax=Triticum aestivum TaxID=4565 RepID=UPI001D02D04C|nr:uncharacterized protein LOC123144531 isoform X2 [Triticum aestivum]
MDAEMPLLQLVTQAKKPMAAPPLQDATRLASAWALVNASIIIVSYALSSAIVPALCQLPCCDLCREDAMERALLIGLWCCSALQAAAAALALLLLCRRHPIRRAVAYLAVAVAIVGHLFVVRHRPARRRRRTRTRLALPLDRLRRGGGGAATPVPLPPDLACPRLPHGRGGGRRPRLLYFGELRSHRRRHRTRLAHRLDSLRGGHVHPCGGRPQLHGPAPGRRISLGLLIAHAHGSAHESTYVLRNQTSPP